MKFVIKGALVLSLGAGFLNAAVLATVNGETITSDELNLMLNQAQMPAFDALNKEDQQKLIGSMVERKLLAQHAQKQGIEKNADYQKALTVLKENLAIDVWLDTHMKSQPVTDAEAKAMYEENKERFRQPEQVRARHILVEKEADAKAIIKELSAKKPAELEAAFEAIAKEKSMDPGSGQRGGDLGYFAKERMVKEFADAAFALKKGEMTKTPVQSAFGYHIIYQVDRKAASVTPYESVAEQMKNNVRMKKFEASLEKLSADLKQKAKITYPNQ